MVSPNTFTRRALCVAPIRAFTLVELLIVLAIISTIAGLTAFFSLDSYYANAREAERKALVTALVAARTRAIDNDYLLPAGVAIYPDDYHGYVIFSGTSYEARLPAYDERIPSSYVQNLATSSPQIIIFTPLSGTTTNATVVFSDPQTGRVSTTTITYEGYIE
jgi:prepilin-type N-terminal cleavage/methylation domain-containing protein